MGSKTQKKLLPECFVEREGKEEERSIRQAGGASAYLPQELFGVASLSNCSGRQIHNLVAVPGDSVEELHLAEHRNTTTQKS